MNGWYRMGYWFDRKDVLPDDGIMCVFHKKRTKPYRILFGGYSERLGFWDKNSGKWYDKGKIDYWMPIPVLPKSL